MINDLPLALNSHTILYADDTTFFHSNSDFKTLQNLNDSTLKEASTWFRANGLILNEGKTQEIFFSLRDPPQQVSIDSVKFLGVYIDHKLSWEPHITYISAKLSRVIFLLRSLKNHVPLNYVRSSYFAFFQSIISYGILLWGNSNHINRILLLQKKAVRIITDSHKLEHCKPLFIKLQLLTVINLYIFKILLFTKNNLSTHQLRQDIHNYNTRNSKQINIPFTRLTKSQNSYEVLGVKMFNAFPSKIADLPMTLFKRELFGFLVNSPFYSTQEFFKSMELSE